MMTQLSHMMTLANSIIGVSVLAMPFCFKQCGIILATLVLLASSILSRLACHFLVKSAVMSRRRNFELLAFHAFGHMGKFVVELFIIGFLLGTCIAFFVVVGDLGPQIVGKIIAKNPEDIRTSLLITTSMFIVLPLGLLRNIDSLSSICTATIVFYLCLVLKIIAESTQHIFAGDWQDHVYYWRPTGILQCLPIFSMALFCQTQLFEIYEAIPNASLEKMNEVVRGALNICTLVYLCVGFFGYIAFCTTSFSGNILMSFEASLSSEMIKMGFVFSVAFSFPLVIFPCRASLNSLLFRRVYTHEPSINYMPEMRFRCLTVAIVGVSLIIGILIPNIEFVLGLVGSTIGVMICLIFPAAFFISISSKNTNERLLAQTILFIGMWIMVLGTYANLYAFEESTSTKITVTTNKPLSQINNLPLNIIKDDIHIIPDVANNLELLGNVKEKLERLPALNMPDEPADAKDIRQEPPIPIERTVITQKSIVETQKSMDNLAATFAPEIKKIVEQMKSLDENMNKNSVLAAKGYDKDRHGYVVTSKSEEKAGDSQKNDNLINSDAIKKEETELAADGELANIIAAEELKKTLEKHKMEELQMMHEMIEVHKELLKDIKEKQNFEKEQQRMAEKDGEESKVGERKLKDKDKLNILEDSINADRKSDKINLKVEKESNAVLPANEDNARKNLNHNNVVKPNEKFATNRKEDTKLNAVKDQNGSVDGTVVKNDEWNNAIDRPNQNLSELKDSKVKRNASSNTLKDPILNALTKRTFKKSILENIKEGVEGIDQIARNKIDTPEKTNLKGSSLDQGQYSVPIALKMRNQTKIESDIPERENVSNNVENIQAVRRDILENRERDKRDVDEEVYKYIKHTSDKPLEMDEVDHAKSCIKQSNEDPQVLKRHTTPESLIKTNIYLSEQGFTHSGLNVDPDIDIERQYVKIKQRDLKALNSD